MQVPGYRIGRVLGRGGFAVVHEAEQLSLGRAVALKMLSPDRADEHDLRRFDRERLLLAELSGHRHIVDVIDAGTASDGRPFIVMRLYRRGSVAQALVDGGPMSPAAVVETVGKLASALQAAHALGVIHRDVKPENVLIADDGEPALADFGISVLASPDGTTGNLFTMAQAAPEVLDRGAYGVASDVYALASTAYTMLTGRPPFTGPNQFAQMRAIFQEPVPPMEVPGVPPALEAAVARGMAKKPEDRYPNAIALADAFRYALQMSGVVGSGGGPALPLPDVVTVSAPVPGSSTQVLPPSPGTTAPTADTGARRSRRRSRGWLAGAGAFLLMGGITGTTYVLGVPPGSLFTDGRLAVTPAAAHPVVLAADFSQFDLKGKPYENPTNRAVDLYLQQVGSRAGDRPVTVRRYEVASPEFTRWDAGACRRAARQHVTAADEVAVIGPYNSGCVKEVLPIVGKDSGSAISVLSNGSTDPGLTKTWGPGEPDRYYPGGVRTFARVVTTDDVQGRAAAAFAARELRVRSVYVLNDGAVYGKHMANAFVVAARAAGITVVGEAQWKVGAKSYRDLFKAVAAHHPDAVFLGGTVARDGARLIADKVATLGDNSAVRLIGPDGFAGDPVLVKLPQAQGMYVTFPGLSPESIRRRGGAGSQFLDAYQARYGSDPPDPYALYGVAAVQVVLQAIEQSDGTRAGVRQAIFSGAGVTVPKAVSVLGADTRIDPATGDVQLKDVTIDVVKRNEETFETIERVP